MKNGRWSRMFTGVTALVLLLGVCLGASSGAGTEPVLSDEDCAKCHDQEPAQIAASGKAHKTEVSCLTCHEGHRPRVANNIPECSQCHSGEPHFEVAGCKTCHNPHAPLDVRLEGELKAVCLTCHQSQGQEMQASPSKHADLACNECHAKKHGATPACLECHDSHSQAITKDDCRTCHQAHQPLTLQYGDKVPNAQCAACHGEVLEQLAANTTKHHAVNCVSCHAKKHKTVPQCSSCHGTPHAPGMHKKFPVCGECHNTAHNLNNWASSEEKGGEKKPR
jgi:predicted CXXCH cytochrome family protein